jgi:hypothetical protein
MPRVEQGEITLLNRLRDAIKDSRRKLEPYRKRHKELVESYVGVYYSNDGAEKSRSLNLIELATNIYERNLSARPPKVLVRTRNKKFRPTGTKLEALINEKLQNRHIHRTIQRCVKAAIYSIGICKVGRKSSGVYMMDGHDISKIEPYIKQILLDDWVHDMDVRDMGDASFCGHRFQIDIEEAKNRPDYDENARKKLQPLDFGHYNEDGDERLHTIGSGYSGGAQKFYEQVELWEIFLPKSRQVVTFDLESGGPAVKVVDWDGPEKGPYHILGYHEVDGQTMPLAPGMVWRGLDETANGLFRKLERQAQRSKTVGLARGEDSEDAERIRSVSDGEVIGVQNPDAVVEKMFGGIDQRNFGFLLQVKEMFSWVAGNLDALGGLGAQSETLGQDRLLFANANQRISGMQDLVIDFTNNMLQDYAYYLWHDPIEDYPVTIKPRAMGRQIEVSLGPEERKTQRFFDHTFDIEPYSMSFSSPQMRMQNVTQILQGVLMPLMPLMQQQGQMIDTAALVDLFAGYADLQELQDIVISEGQMMMKQQGAPPNATETGAQRDPLMAPSATPPPQGGPQGDPQQQGAAPPDIESLMSGPPA